MVALAFGAASVTTVEYNELSYDHPLVRRVHPSKILLANHLSQITTATPTTFIVPQGGFDVAFSMSSFDHDGLGRYGDPINPEADISASHMVQCVVKPGALFFLTVPIGPDVVVFNLHRRYGSPNVTFLFPIFFLIVGLCVLYFKIQCVGEFISNPCIGISFDLLKM